MVWLAVSSIACSLNRTDFLHADARISLPPRALRVTSPAFLPGAIGSCKMEGNNERDFKREACVRGIPLRREAVKKFRTAIEMTVPSRSRLPSVLPRRVTEPRL